MSDDDEPPRTLGEEIIAWIKNACLVPEGALFGQPIALMPWQPREILRIYDNSAVTRRAIHLDGTQVGQDLARGLRAAGASGGTDSVPRAQM